MIDYYRLSRNPRWFKSFSGVTVIEFEELYAPVVPVWTAQEQARLNRAGRQRAVGGGRPYDLPLRERLWLKLYLTTEALGYLFGVDNSTVSRNLRRLLPTLQAWGTATLGWATPPTRGQTQSLAQACAEQPDWFAIVDATEQPVRRASDSDTQCQQRGKTRKSIPATYHRGYSFIAIGTNQENLCPLRRPSHWQRVCKDEPIQVRNSVLLSTCEKLDRVHAAGYAPQKNRLSPAEPVPIALVYKIKRGS